jgi:hypothetical protein
MSERLILLTVPPAATLRDRDAADLEMLEATLKWRESADLTGQDEFGPLSGNRWHLVLRRFLDEATDTNRYHGAAELEYLVKLLERDGTCRHGTERRWADILRRFIHDDYDVPTGRPKQEVRDQLLSRHYWLLRRIYPSLSENDCAENVARVYADVGGKLSASRIKRIVKTAQNRKAGLAWINDQIKALANCTPSVAERALLATFEPLAADRKVLAAIFGQEVK